MPNTKFKTIVLIGALCALPMPAAAQTADEKAVQSFIEGFLTRLGDHQFDTLDADFAPKALIVVSRQRGSEWTNTYQTGEEWLAALKKNPNPTTFREPITNVKVTLDSNQLAHLRADFQVVRDGAVLSSGVDQFTLVRDGSRWKIAVVAYTSIATPR
jgi:SnoaL-like protein